MELKSLFKNGRIPNKNLKAIDTGQLLQKDASISYMRMKSQAKKDGINIDLSGKSSAYRLCGQKGDYNKGLSNGQFTQWYAWELYKSGKGNLAANPSNSSGCSSNHGWGIAIDVKGTQAQNWIKKNGAKYGWWWSGGTFSKIENWHFDYNFKKDTYYKETKQKTKNAVIYSLIGIVVVSFGFSMWYFTRPNKK